MLYFPNFVVTIGDVVIVVVVTSSAKERRWTGGVGGVLGVG